MKFLTVLLTVVTVATIFPRRAEAHSRTLRPIAADRKVVTYSSLLATYAAQIAADRSELQRLAGAAGHSKQRAALLSQIKRDRITAGAIRAGESPQKWELSLSPRTLAFGQIGVFSRDQDFRIAEIPTSHSALIRMYYIVGESAYDGPIVDSALLFIHGFKFSGLATGECRLPIHGPVRVTTRTYTTVLGATNTVFEITPVRFVDDLRRKS